MVSENGKGGRVAARHILKVPWVVVALVAMGASAVPFVIVESNMKSGEPAAHAERHVKNVRQLTRGSQNTEARFSFDGQRLIFQSTRDGPDCYQQYVMGLDGGDVRRVSTGDGATTDGYFLPGDRRVMYASTYMKDPQCSPKPSAQGREPRALDEYDIFTANIRGADLFRLTASPGYDAEATIAPNGSRIVFTSIRDGDLDI